MVKLNFIPNPKNDFYKKKEYGALIERNAKYKGFCKYFVITSTKEKRCVKYQSLCSDNKDCRIRKNTLENVL